MRLTLRFLLPLALVLAVFGYMALPLVDKLTLGWFVRDMETRSQVLARSMEQPLISLLSQKKGNQIVLYFNQIQETGRLYAIGFCDRSEVLRYKTGTFPSQLKCFSKTLSGEPVSQTLSLPSGMLQASVFPIQGEQGPEGKLVFLHDMSFVAHRSAETRRYMLSLFVILGLMISFVTVLVAQLSWREFVQRLRKSLRAGNILKGIGQLRGTELAPLAKDLRALMRDIEVDRNAKVGGNASVKHIGRDGRCTCWS